MSRLIVIDVEKLEAQSEQITIEDCSMAHLMGYIAVANDGVVTHLVEESQ